ncbi:hypothetical protein C8A01DRAFT_34996 [Parachaetomium inaequale]|uniref:Uncharacterized protein n=1 Tax=Parachaetomium inaequale TaxID=2588326 RepID=A0AAN6SRZ4_9PEZI|nr:hypothetical protein C8A01DRAFT_34996 [Parachaetomium inaequale]
MSSFWPPGDGAAPAAGTDYSSAAQGNGGGNGNLLSRHPPLRPLLPVTALLLPRSRAPLDLPEHSQGNGYFDSLFRPLVMANVLPGPGPQADIHHRADSFPPTTPNIDPWTPSAASALADSFPGPGAQCHIQSHEDLSLAPPPQYDNYGQWASPPRAPASGNTFSGPAAETYAPQQNDDFSSGPVPHNAQQTMAFGAPALGSSFPGPSYHQYQYGPFPSVDQHINVLPASGVPPAAPFPGQVAQLPTQLTSRPLPPSQHHGTYQSAAFTDADFPDDDIYGDDDEDSSAPRSQACAYPPPPSSHDNNSGGSAVSQPTFSDNNPTVVPGPAGPFAPAAGAPRAPSARAATADPNPGGLLKLPGSVRSPSPVDQSLVGEAALALLSDEEIGKPLVPPGVEGRYWRKLARAAADSGKTRQLAYEKLAQDVAGSLARRKPGSDRDVKDAFLRVASETWDQNTQIVRHLARRGIVLRRSDWLSIDSSVVLEHCDAERADAVYGHHWMTNVKDKKMDKDKENEEDKGKDKSKDKENDKEDDKE